VFKEIYNYLQRKSFLSGYRTFKKYILLSVDATGIFSSERVYCEHCCEKNSKGKKMYYHQIVAGVIVHPSKREVFPLGMEPVYKESKSSKNDCEINATKRFLKDIKKDYPNEAFIIVTDALYANVPYILGLKKLDMEYIIGAKPGKNKNLFEWIEGIELSEYKVYKEGITYHYKFINGIPISCNLEKP